jgi:hypothetical protein
MKMGMTTLCDVPPYAVMIKLLVTLRFIWTCFATKKPPLVFPNPVIDLHPWFMSLGMSGVLILCFRVL